MGGQEVMVRWEMEQPLAVLRAELSKELIGGAPLGFPSKALYKRSCSAVGRRNHNHDKAFKRAEGSAGSGERGRGIFL